MRRQVAVRASPSLPGHRRRTMRLRPHDRRRDSEALFDREIRNKMPFERGSKMEDGDDSLGAFIPSEYLSKLMARIVVVGTGHVGLVHAVAFALGGHRVIGVDVDARAIADQSRGRPTFFEPGL